MIEAAGPILAASLLGSPHCAGMCGPFVCFYSGQDGSPRWQGHLAYHGGRLASYLVLGGAAGAAGAGIDRVGAAAGVSRLAAVAAGLLMIAWGGLTLLRARGLHVPLPRLVTVTGVARRIGARLGERPPVARALLLGLFTTLLPCGWLYVFVAAAAGTGSPAGGVGLMGVFWLGTVPILTGIGLAAQQAIGPLRRHLPTVTAAALLLIGILTATGRMIRAPAATAHPETRQHAGH